MCEKQADFWQTIYDWVVMWFRMNEDVEFPLEVIYKDLTGQMLDEGEVPPTYDNFEINFKDWIGNYREFEFSDKYFINTEFGWMLTSNHDLVVENIEYLENKILQLENQEGK